MPIQVQCPKCGSIQHAGDHAAGLTTPCANCGANVFVPEARKSSRGSLGASLGVVAAVALVVLLICGGLIGGVVYLVVAEFNDARERARAAPVFQAQLQNALERQEQVEDGLQQSVADLAAVRVAEAMLEFDRAHGAIPAHASYGDDGRPHLSWRVHLLPFLGEQELYDKFKLDEPWDSDHNAALIPQMPAVYVDRSLGEAGKTSILVAVGTQTLFPPEPGADPLRGVGRFKLANLAASENRKVLAFAAAPHFAVTWTAPHDWNFAPDAAPALFGEQRHMTLILDDGRVIGLMSSDAESLNGLLQRDQP